MADQTELQEMLAHGEVTVKPYEGADLRNNPAFRKIELDASHMSMLSQQLLPAVSAGVVANAYCIRFPAGLPHTLMQYSTGGLGTPILGKGGIVGHAALYSLTPMAAVMSVFAVMAAVTGQFYLTQINAQLNKINLKLERILAFLYGDKKAELISEVTFIQYAQQCFSAIMQHSDQRVATITNIQNAGKVAMKDIEFYLGDLYQTVMEEKETKDKAEKCTQIADSLQLAIQLYVLSSILEVYYAGNFTADYLSYVEKTVKEYIERCEKRMLSSMSMLQKEIADAAATKKRGKQALPEHQQAVDAVTAALQKPEESAVYTLHRALFAPTEQTEIYLTSGGEAYIAAAQ